MAQPLTYTPPPPAAPDPAEAARAELEALLVALHTSGTLRVLHGLFGRLSDVAGVAVGQLDTPAGQHVLGNLAVLGQALAALEPAQVQAFVEALPRGLDAAAERLRAEPPSTLGVLHALRDPDTRRGLHAVLALLQALGRSTDERKQG